MSKMDSRSKWYALPEKKILILFILSTAYFLFQHYVSFSWDFSSYVENARYFFSDGSYLEPLRPPLMPLLLGSLSFLGFRVAEYMFIFLASYLFMQSSVKLADALKFNRIAFYALSLNAYILLLGLYNGTELLSVALLELSIASIIRQESISGFWLGLSAMARYTGLALAPILFLLLNPKKIIKSLVLFSIPVGIWFIYNYLKWGNLFTSIADQYANNILYREYLIQPIEPLHFLIVLNIFAPFFIIGLVRDLYSVFEEMHKKYKQVNILENVKAIITDKKAEILMFGILLFSVISYSNIPLKDARYLFTMTVPAIYYSYLGVRYIASKIKRPIVTLSIVLFLLSFVFVISGEITRINDDSIISFFDYDTPDKYLDSIERLDTLGVKNCSVMSNAWVLMNYLGQTSKNPPRAEFVEEELENGEIMVLFYSIGEPEYVRDATFMDTLPTLHKSDSYIILGETDVCLPVETVENTYTGGLAKVIYKLQGETINTNPCIILFGRKPLLEKSCNLVNLNGFKLDENRWTGA